MGPPSNLFKETSLKAASAVRITVLDSAPGVQHLAEQETCTDTEHLHRWMHPTDDTAVKEPRVESLCYNCLYMMGEKDLNSSLQTIKTHSVLCI